MKKDAEFHLPIFKQGDDLAMHLKDTDSVSEALQSYAGTLRGAADLCDMLSARLKGKDVDVQADAYYICLTGPEVMIDELIECGLVSKPPWDEDEEADEPEIVEHEEP